MEENKKTEPSEEDQDKVDQRHKLGRLRIDIKEELEPAMIEYEKGEFLEKPDEDELKERDVMREKRKKELEKELEDVKRALKERNKP